MVALAKHHLNIEPQETLLELKILLLLYSPLGILF